MSSEIHTLSDESRRILHVLMQGMLTTDDVKSDGYLTRDEVAAVAGLPAHVAGEALLTLETLGYVINQAWDGADPTLDYKGIAQPNVEGTREPWTYRRYSISEHGKRLVLAQALDEGSDQATAS